jgi:hypothetical protein
MKNITLEQTVCRMEEKLLISPLGNELVMMDVDNGSYHNINVVGTRIWEMIKEPVVVKDLLQQLLQTFDVDEQQCQTELLEFLSILNKHHLLKLS